MVLSGKFWMYIAKNSQLSTLNSQLFRNFAPCNQTRYYLWEVFLGPYQWKNVRQTFSMAQTISHTSERVAEVWLHTARKRVSTVLSIILRALIFVPVLRRNCLSLMVNRALVSLVTLMRSQCCSTVTWGVLPL